MQAEPSAIVYRAAVTRTQVLVILPGYGAPPLAFAGYMQRAQFLPATDVVYVQYGFHFMSFEDLAERIWDMLAALGYVGAIPIVLMGYSMGGMIAQTLAAQQPDGVAAVVLVSTGTAANGLLPLTLRGKIMEAVKAIFTFGGKKKKDTLIDDDTDTRAKLPRGLAATTDEQAMLRNLVGRKSVSNTVNTNVQMRSLLRYMDASRGKTLTDSVSLITQPVLILHGTSDSVLDIKSARALHAALPTTSTLVEFPGAGHGIIFENPKQISATVNDWLAKQTLRPATTSSIAASTRHYSFASVRLP